MTEYEILELAHRVCWKYKCSKDPAHSDTYTFNKDTMLEFARVMEYQIKNGVRGVIKNEAASWTGTTKEAVAVAAQHMLDAL